jgi:hypothetical protein
MTTPDPAVPQSFGAAVPVSPPATPFPVPPAVPAEGPVSGEELAELRRRAALAPPDAAPPAAAAEVPASAPALPAPGMLARATLWDAYASPMRERTQLILVTGHDEEDDGQGGIAVKVRGFTLGYEDEAGAFVPGSLEWQ